MSKGSNSARLIYKSGGKYHKKRAMKRITKRLMKDGNVSSFTGIKFVTTQPSDHNKSEAGE